MFCLQWRPLTYTFQATSFLEFSATCEVWKEIKSELDTIETIQLIFIILWCHQANFQIRQLYSMSLEHLLDDPVYIGISNASKKCSPFLEFQTILGTSIELTFPKSCVKEKFSSISILSTTSFHQRDCVSWLFYT